MFNVAELRLFLKDKIPTQVSAANSLSKQLMMEWKIEDAVR